MVVALLSNGTAFASLHLLNRFDWPVFFYHDSGHKYKSWIYSSFTNFRVFLQRSSFSNTQICTHTLNEVKNYEINCFMPIFWGALLNYYGNANFMASSFQNYLRQLVDVFWLGFYQIHYNCFFGKVVVDFYGKSTRFLI